MEAYILGVLRSGFLRPITDCRSQKAVSADPITDTDLFKAIFLSCRIIYTPMICPIICDTPISIFRHLFSAWISFLKMGGSPLLGDSCERGFFNLRGGGGRFLDIFQKYTFISPKCLIIQCIFCFYNSAVVAETLPHSTSLISHRRSTTDPSVYHKHNILSIILISNPNIVTENAFSLWFFFLLQ